MTISWPAVRIRNTVFINASHGVALDRAIKLLERDERGRAQLMADIDKDREPIEFGYADPTNKYALFEHEGVNFQPFGPDDKRKERYVKHAIERGDHLPHDTLRAMRQTWAQHRHSVHWYEDKVRLAGHVLPRITPIGPAEVPTNTKIDATLFEYEREWRADPNQWKSRLTRITCQGVVIQDWS